MGVVRGRRLLWLYFVNGCRSSLESRCGHAAVSFCASLVAGWKLFLLLFVFERDVDVGVGAVDQVLSAVRHGHLIPLALRLTQ